VKPEITPELWLTLSALLDQALDLPEPDRPAFVRRLEERDPDQGEWLRDLLRALDTTTGVLERPAGEDAGEALRRLAEDGHDRTDEALAGWRVGAWRMLREIGRGGMGIVYLAERADGQFEQRAALKLLKRGLDTDEIQRRFLRERQILARLQHPHIARLLDGGVTDDGRPFFVMEHVVGRPITDDCDSRRATIDERLRLFRDVCEAVQYAHQGLVVHRDLKPSNILATSDGRVKLLDFGIARLLSEEGGEAAATLTHPGSSIMTPQYAAPEQVRGEPATTATDVYALGLVLYEILAGRRPYVVRATDPAEAARVILETSPAPPSRAIDRPDAATARGTTPERLRRRLRGDLDAIVMAALRKEPERRHPTAAALGEDIERFLRRLPVRARPDTPGYRLRRFLDRHRTGATAAALVSASLVAGLAGTIWEARAARQQARRAEEVKNFLAGIFEVSDPSRSRGENVTARELLERGAQRIDAELKNQPVLRADMLGVLADVYERLGLYDQAAPLAQRSLDLWSGLRPAGDPEVAEALRRQGVVLIDRGRYDEAERVLRRALDGHRRGGEEVDARLAETLDSLAMALRSGGKLDEAESLVRETVAIRRRAFGPGSPEMATSLNNLALMLRERGRFDEAEPLYREALVIRRRTLGTDHPDVAGTLNNLAALLRQQGRLEEAESAARESAAINRKLFGEDNPNTIQSLNSLAAIAQSLGRYDEAETIHRTVLDFWRRHQGEEHPNALASLNNLASVLKDRGDFAAAEPMFRRLVDLFPKVVGANHPFTAIAMTHLGVILTDEEKYDEAEPLLRRALGIQTALRGEAHPDTAGVMVQLGALEQRRGRLDEAEPLLRRALAIREASLGAAHPSTAAGRAALGSLLRQRGRLDEASSLGNAALAAQRKSFPAGHPDIALAALELGRTESALGRHERAVPLLREAFEIRREVFGEGAWRTAEAGLRLAETLAASGQAAEALPLLQRSARVLREQRGADCGLTREAEDSLRRLRAV
jgi:serine/threonine protein kinase/Tfp pilus assembly protein PilF